MDVKISKLFTKIIDISILHKELDRHLQHHDINAANEVSKELKKLKLSIPESDIREEVSLLRSLYSTKRLDRIYIAYLLNCDIKYVDKVEGDPETTHETLEYTMPVEHGFDEFFI